MLKEFFELDIRFHVTPPRLISFAKCLFNHRDLRFIFLPPICVYLLIRIFWKKDKFSSFIFNNLFEKGECR